MEGARTRTQGHRHSSVNKLRVRHVRRFDRVRALFYRDMVVDCVAVASCIFFAVASCYSLYVCVCKPSFTVMCSWTASCIFFAVASCYSLYVCVCKPSFTVMCSWTASCHFFCFFLLPSFPVMCSWTVSPLTHMQASHSSRVVPQRALETQTDMNHTRTRTRIE